MWLNNVSPGGRGLADRAEGIGQMREVFQAFAALLDEGDAALNRAARFVKDNTVQRAAA